MSIEYDYIFKETLDELDYAKDKWGEAFDSKNTLNDWGTYITGYLGRATAMGIDETEQRRQLIKVIGLAMNAVKWLDSGKMPKRHYDK